MVKGASEKKRKDDEGKIPSRTLFLSTWRENAICEIDVGVKNGAEGGETRSMRKKKKKNLFY